ncbi:hypothetical protein AB0K71_05870 [Streptomyces syringium]|uniref:hypothetical protein n=1 Tax=Streptomyces syringium TaxID=76729 RepID=UPI00342DF27B
MADDGMLYDSRTAIRPDGSRITIVFRVGSDIGQMSEAEFVAQFAPTPVRPRHLRVVPDPRPEPDAQQT